MAFSALSFISSLPNRSAALCNERASVFSPQVRDIRSSRLLFALIQISQTSNHSYSEDAKF